MSTMSRTSATDAGLAGLMLALLSCLPVCAPVAQPLFKYLGEDGVWVFADRPPEQNQVYEEIAVDRRGAPALVRMYQSAREDGSIELRVENTFRAPMQIAFQLTSAENLAPGTPTRGNRILLEQSDTDLVTLAPADVGLPMRVAYRYQFIHGRPGARHDPNAVYRVPYALANSHRVSQAYPDQLTHTDPASQHAIDFEMPIGSGVYAAREGTVIEVASDYFEAGLDPDEFASRANIVRILHADGTIALYGHLNWNSIRVAEGQTVARGEYIADSGNTGFSTGPHLHFVVQRNAGGLIESVPVVFAGPGGAPVSFASGDVATAY